MKTTKLFDPDEEIEDFSWVWDKLAEWGGCGCWEWIGELSERGRPLTNIQHPQPAKSLHRVMCFLHKGKWAWTGKIVPCTKHEWCVNWAHFKFN